MKIDIISGFLGAGKTTLIKKLIKEELFKEKIAIIENEYGEVAIDGILLKDEKVEVKEISSGCICCNIKGDFKESIKSIVDEYNSERIIIEPTGVAKLSEVIKSVKEAGIKQGDINVIATVVNVTTFSDYIKNFGEFFKDQIANANVIILSRVSDKTTSELNNILTEICNINKKANIVTTELSKVKAKRILEIGAITKEEINIAFRKFETQVVSAKKTIKPVTSVFDNWGVETSKVFDREKIQSALSKLDKDESLGNIVRAKGIVETTKDGWIRFDYVPGEIKIEKFSADYTGRVCVIGSNLNKNAIKNLFMK
ncbi:MAG: CobW family GTP-binding protein [Sarcina sp.]